MTDTPPDHDPFQWPVGVPPRPDGVTYQEWEATLTAEQFRTLRAWQRGNDRHITRILWQGRLNSILGVIGVLAFGGAVYGVLFVIWLFISMFVGIRPE